jgi:antirestriction protein ArdC
MEKEKVTPFQIITDRIVAALDKGVVPWRRPWHVDGRARNLQSGKDYNGINALILGMVAREHGCAWFLTFNQARARGGRVRKGEKGHPCFFWKIDTVKDKKTGKDERRFIGRYYTVFNAKQCDGIDVPAPPVRASIDPVVAADRIIMEYKGTPEIRDGGDRAFYDPMGDFVGMPAREKFESAPAFYSTMFHELTHSTGHASRLGRFDNTQRLAAFGSADYGREELIAEMGACFLSSVAGVEMLDASAAYIGHWRKAIKDDPRAVIVAASAAEKAAKHILGTPPADATPAPEVS